MIRLFLLFVVACFLSATSSLAFSQIPEQWIDAKYCGPPQRDANGEIVRSTTAIKYFKLQNPCPSTRLTFGPCPLYRIDHTRPLARGGCDHPTNMQWLKASIKECAGTECKDRWELDAYQLRQEER